MDAQMNYYNCKGETTKKIYPIHIKMHDFVKWEHTHP